MAEQPIITTPSKPKPKVLPEPTGYVVKKDATIAGPGGIIRVEAYKTIRDKFIIHQLQAANVPIEPVYD